jgi:GNAT superfamily N-acetyltransferase
MDAHRPARLDDLDDLLALQRAYYAEDGYPFDPATARDAFAQLLADPALGAAWIARAQDGRALAYVVLTLGWSLEFGGRDGFVDELYVTPAARGRGLGRAGLARAEAGARARGVRRLHLEVEDGKPAAHELYRRSGFAGHGRTLMSKPLAPADAPHDSTRPRPGAHARR